MAAAGNGRCSNSSSVTDRNSLPDANDTFSRTMSSNEQSATSTDNERDPEQDGLIFYL
jgi:hypothetical protein